MTQQHPMVPSNILLNNWESDWFDERENVDVLLIQAYQAGADAELEACCEWLHKDNCSRAAHRLYDARRPKPPSLKRVALQALLHLVHGAAHSMDTTESVDYIRRALEQLPDNE